MTIGNHERETEMTTTHETLRPGTLVRDLLDDGELRRVSRWEGPDYVVLYDRRTLKDLPDYRHKTQIEETTMSQNEDQKPTTPPALPEGKTTHAELEAAGWEFPADRKGRKAQVGYYKVGGKVVATCRLSNQRFVELLD
jgi:hypothetical protein